MAKNRTNSKPKPATSKPATSKSATSKSGKSSRSGSSVKAIESANLQTEDYRAVLNDLTQRIHASRHLALAAVNRELVCVYWHIGKTIVAQQDSARWGDAVVEQLARDLRLAFPDMKGFTKDNLFRMRKFYRACVETDQWLVSDQLELQDLSSKKKVGTPSPLSQRTKTRVQILSTASKESDHSIPIVGTVSPQLQHAGFGQTITSLSWSHLTIVVGAVNHPAERWFYMQMSIRERWSVRELRRQIDADLFNRYVSVKSDPEKCLPDDPESGDLLPFKDHYVLEFLGLEDQHSEKELRKAILANLRNFFLEFGKDLAFVGEEYPLTVGADTFYIDLLFFHRRLQCLISVDLKKGKFKPEYAGKSCFYCAALDEQIRLPHENPSIGLVLCRTADTAQVQLALTAAASNNSLNCRRMTNEPK